MRLQKHIGSDDLGLQLRMAAQMPRILRAAHVVPGPAVEAAFLNVGDVVRNQIVAEHIALVGGAPELSRDGVNSLAAAITDAVGVDLTSLPSGVNSSTSAR